MKKKKLSSLSLNKKTISKFNSSKITGGGYTDGPSWGGCAVNTVSCNANGCSVTHPPQTQGPGCTRPTLELSYCQGIQGVPVGCISVNPCA